MPDETIYCPACNHKLRVPEDQLGQVVQCPMCRVIFTAPSRSPTPPVLAPQQPAPAPLPEAEVGPLPPAPPTPEPEESEPMPEARRLLFGPASGLLLCGILGLMWNLRMVRFLLERGPGEMARLYEEARESVPAWLAPVVQTIQPVSPETLYQSQLLSNSICALVSLGVLIGAIQMFRLRLYGLAVLGSILALVNLEGFCCLFSFPLGLWSLLLLRLPEVRKAFE